MAQSMPEVGQGQADSLDLVVQVSHAHPPDMGREAVSCNLETSWGLKREYPIGRGVIRYSMD